MFVYSSIEEESPISTFICLLGHPKTGKTENHHFNKKDLRKGFKVC
jgi:hypothetical protein